MSDSETLGLESIRKHREIIKNDNFEKVKAILDRECNGKRERCPIRNPRNASPCCMCHVNDFLAREIVEAVT